MPQRRLNSPCLRPRTKLHRQAALPGLAVKIFAKLPSWRNRLTEIASSWSRFLRWTPRLRSARHDPAELGEPIFRDLDEHAIPEPHVADPWDRPQGKAMVREGLPSPAWIFENFTASVFAMKAMFASRFTTIIPPKLYCPD